MKQPLPAHRLPSTRSMVVILIALLLAALPVMQAHAATNSLTPITPVSITVGAQSGILTYGASATADFVVTVLQPGPTGSVVTLSVTGLPSGASASWSINPVAASEGPGVITTLHITTTGGHGGTPAGSWLFTVHNDLDTNTGSQTLSVGKKALTVSATGVNKIYDGTAAADVTLSTDALLGDDVTTAMNGATFADKNVGVGKTVSVTGISISGADADNYELLSTSASTAADINQAPLTVTAYSYVPSTAARLSRSTAPSSRPRPARSSMATCSRMCMLTSDGAARRCGPTGAYPIVASPPLIGTGLDNYHITYVNGILSVFGCDALPVITEGATVSRSMSVNGKPIAFGLTLHATDICGDPLTWSISSPAAHGSAPPPPAPAIPWSSVTSQRPSMLAPMPSRSRSQTASAVRPASSST